MGDVQCPCRLKWSKGSMSCGFLRGTCLSWEICYIWSFCIIYLLFFIQYDEKYRKFQLYFLTNTLILMLIFYFFINRFLGNAILY